MIYFTLGIQYQHVLFHASEERNVALDNGQHVGVVLMDLSKAFDDIPHGLLFNYIVYIFYFNICLWDDKKFSNQQDANVRFDDVRSNWKSIVCGVPHMPQAGPRIFNIFLNDLFYF